MSRPIPGPAPVMGDGIVGRRRELDCLRAWLDDVHWADEPSLLVLRHVADQIAGARLLVFATFRDVEPASVLPRVLPDLLRAPAVERLDLRGFGLVEVREQLSKTTGGRSEADARAVLDVTGGNPLFVREVARATADGTWRPDRPPRTVLDAVRARLDRVSAECRRLVQAAAIVGRDFSLPLVAAALDQPVERCLGPIDEAVGYGLVDQVGDVGDYRFVHALTGEAVEASLTSAGRIALHRAVAEATEATSGVTAPRRGTWSIPRVANAGREWGPGGAGCRAFRSRDPGEALDPNAPVGREVDQARELGRVGQLQVDARDAPGLARTSTWALCRESRRP